VVELGPGTGLITNALIEHGVDQKRLVLVEYNPGFCALLRDALSAGHRGAGRCLCAAAIR
jgi:phospholipid N-methyltransferase